MFGYVLTYPEGRTGAVDRSLTGIPISESSKRVGDFPLAAALPSARFDQPNGDLGIGSGIGRAWRE
jgi:hypothetical protein